MQGSEPLGAFLGDGSASVALVTAVVGPLGSAAAAVGPLRVIRGGTGGGGTTCGDVDGITWGC